MTSDDQNTNGEIILVLDFGSQYTQLLAQRVRENQNRRAKTDRDYFVGGPVERLRRDRAENRPGNLQTRRSDIRRLLRHAVDM